MKSVSAYACKAVIGESNTNRVTKGPRWHVAYGLWQPDNSPDDCAHCRTRPVSNRFPHLRSPLQFTVVRLLIHPLHAESAFGSSPLKEIKMRKLPARGSSRRQGRILMPHIY